MNGEGNHIITLRTELITLNGRSKPLPYKRADDIRPYNASHIFQTKGKTPMNSAKHTNGRKLQHGTVNVVLSIVLIVSVILQFLEFVGQCGVILGKCFSVLRECFR